MRANGRRCLARLQGVNPACCALEWQKQQGQKRCIASGLVCMTRECVSGLASESTPRPYLSFLMVISDHTDFTPLVLRAVESA